MSTQFRTALTPSEAKAAADRQDVWRGEAWMIMPVEAASVKHDGLQKLFLKDDPTVTSDLDLIDQVRFDGHLTIKKNPYLPLEETDYDTLLAERQSQFEQAGIEIDVSKSELLSGLTAAQAENEELKKKLAEFEKEKPSAKAAKEPKAAKAEGEKDPTPATPDPVDPAKK